MRAPTYKMKTYLIGILAVVSIVLVLVYSQIISPSGSRMDATEDPFLTTRMATKEVKIVPECRKSPSPAVEQSKRHIVQTVRDQWLFMNNQIRLLQRLSDDSFNDTSSYEKFRNTLQYMSAHGSEYARVIELEMNKLNHLDGWDEWRSMESQKLKETVRQRIYNLQNPKNCSETPVLVCNLKNYHGFASGVHDILGYFVKAYQEKRRLVLNSSNWHYTREGWETLFQPLSDTCTNAPRNETPLTLENNDRVRWIMRTLPQDLGTKIVLLHGNPLAWWYGQFVSYLMRPNKQLQSSLERMKQKVNFTTPIVGIHVRRTDKVREEAQSHELEEYMEHAEDYFRSLELESSQTVKRRVFIATDEPNVLKECNIKYPEYECLYNAGSAESATKIKTRYGNHSLRNLVADIYALASADYMVCTFSSGMCRLAFELKLAIDEKSVDASYKAASLDIFHHYDWVRPPTRIAIYNHKPKSSKEIPFNRGDVLIHRDGFHAMKSAGEGKEANGLLEMINLNKQRVEGLIPAYKTREHFPMHAY